MNSELFDAQFLLKGEQKSLRQWFGHPILIVNTATQCGLYAAVCRLRNAT